MDFESLLQTYGYYALFIGTFLEGETILVLAGFLANQGYMKLQWVILLAFLGSLSGDTLVFHLGRWKGRAFLARRPHWDKRAAHVQRALDKYQIYAVLSFRFFYGLRNFTPFVIGSTGFSPKRFFLLNAAGAAIWAAVVGTGGYIFGEAISLFFEDVRKYVLWLLLFGVIAGCVLWFLHSRSLRRREAAELEQAGVAQDAERIPPAIEGCTSESRRRTMVPLGTAKGSDDQSRPPQAD
ncbi:MAG: DedA family protein [Planctomycetota bacterium]